MPGQGSRLSPQTYLPTALPRRNPSFRPSCYIAKGILAVKGRP